MSVVGVLIMFPLDRLTIVNGAVQGWDDIWAWGPLPDDLQANPTSIPHLGMVGLALGAAVSSWLEYRLLSQALAWRIGRSYLGGRWINPISAGCIAMALVAFAADWAFGDRHAVVAAALVLGPSGLAYVAVTRWLKVPECLSLLDRASGMTARLRR